MRFKDDVIAARFDDMHPQVQRLAVEMDEWSKTNYGIELTITATVSTHQEDRELGRQSDTHRTGRAFDVRVKDLPDSFIAELCAVFRKKYGSKLGAVSNNQANLIVYKPHGTGPHLHIQLNRKYQRLVGAKSGKDKA
jgi:hypothetical protein